MKIKREYISPIFLSLLCATITTVWAKHYHHYFDFIERIVTSKYDDYAFCSIEYAIFIIILTILIILNKNKKITLNDNKVLLYIVLYPIWLSIIYLIIKPSVLFKGNFQELFFNQFLSFVVRVFISGTITAIYFLILNLISKVISFIKKI